ALPLDGLRLEEELAHPPLQLLAERGRSAPVPGQLLGLEDGIRMRPLEEDDAALVLKDAIDERQPLRSRRPALRIARKARVAGRQRREHESLPQQPRAVRDIAREQQAR